MKRRISNWPAGLAVGLALAGGAGDVRADDASPLVWRVEQRFRLWDAAEPGRLESLLDALTGPVAPAALHDDTVAFLRAEAGLHRAGHWDPVLEGYEPAWVHPQAYRVEVGLAAPPPGALCRWRTTLGTLSATEAPCDRRVRLTLPAITGGTETAVVTAEPHVGAVVSAPVTVRDRLIASIGDSFASGEGDPDRPSSFESLGAGLEGRWKADWAGGRWLGRTDAVRGLQPAEWWEPRCHRSFYSMHLVAALKYAADHPHEAVTFVSYACSGAAVFDGVLTRQSDRIGFRDAPGFAPPRRPQVEALVADLCAPGDAGAGAKARYDGRAITDDGRVRPVAFTTDTVACAGDRPRRAVDLLLVSVGGNDVGFTPVIFDGLLPRRAANAAGEPMLAGTRALLTLSPGQANVRIQRTLPGALAALDARLHAALPERPTVLHTAYPDPTRAETGALCGARDELASPQGHPHDARLAAIAAAWPDAAARSPRLWRMSIDQADGRAVQQSLIGPLNATLADFDREAGWVPVNDFAEAFAGRGWCASDGADQADLPDWSPERRAWSDWDPSTWDPYARRLRLFRTPNDSALSQAPARPRRAAGAAAPLLEPWVSERQDGLLVSLSGAFHPTFEGHAIIGLSLARAMATPSAGDREDAVASAAP